jgi:hypothetical protein
VVEAQATYLSYYPLQPVGEALQVVLPTVPVERGGLRFNAKGVDGWGEALVTNTLKLAQFSAGDAPPADPLPWQPWFDTLSSELKVWNGTAWVVLAAPSLAAPSSYRHTQATAATTWTVTHNLALDAPFVSHVSVFRLVGSDYKLVSPQDITFDDASTLTVTFASPSEGYVLVRR